MATAAVPVSPPDIRGIVAPLLPSLPGAAVSTQPAPAVLPLLSPILRQRVQLLSSASNEPWLRLLSYDAAKAPRLAELVSRPHLEPHPVSGEVEVDWDHDVETKYRRLDRETLQALVVLQSFELFFRLVYCTGDSEGGGDGWRVGEISVADSPAPFASFGGKPNIAEAEQEFEAGRAQLAAPGGSRIGVGSRGAATANKDDGEDDDDDDGYWDRYDATPATRTPAIKRSPAPASGPPPGLTTHTSHTGEDAYFAQYDSVQPAMDNYDPDEAAHMTAMGETPPPPLGLARPPASGHRTLEDDELNETNGVWTLAGGPESSSSAAAAASSPSQDDDARERYERLVQPRPASSAAGSRSSGSSMVAKLEESAERRDQGEFGVRQHVSSTLKSLFRLSRASGIDRDEFERMVKTELDLLGLMED